MSRKSNPTLIGGFVIGAVVLLVVAVMLFGGAELFAPKSRLVAYFPGSVQGLRVGSNVLFRGVRIGFVEDMQLQGDADTLETQVQVIMQVFPDLYQLTRGGRAVDDRGKVDVGTEDFIEAGARAQLATESLVTGQLLVELDFHPDQEAVFRGEDPPYPEVPTIPSDIQQILQKVRNFVATVGDKVDIEEIAEDLQSALQGIDELANSQDLRDSLAGVNRLINAEDTQQLTARLGLTLADARGALKDIRKLVNNADDRVGPLLDDLRPVVARLDRTLAAGETALENAAAQVALDVVQEYAQRPCCALYFKKRCVQVLGQFGVALELGRGVLRAHCLMTSARLLPA